MLFGARFGDLLHSDHALTDHQTATDAERVHTSGMRRAPLFHEDSHPGMVSATWRTRKYYKLPQAEVLISHLKLIH